MRANKFFIAAAFLGMTGMTGTASAGKASAAARPVSKQTQRTMTLVPKTTLRFSPGSRLGQFERQHSVLLSELDRVAEGGTQSRSDSVDLGKLMFEYDQLVSEAKGTPAERKQIATRYITEQLEPFEMSFATARKKCPRGQYNSIYLEHKYEPPAGMVVDDARETSAMNIGFHAAASPAYRRLLATVQHDPVAMLRFMSEARGEAEAVGTIAQTSRTALYGDLKVALANQGPNKSVYFKDAAPVDELVTEAMSKLDATLAQKDKRSSQGYAMPAPKTPDEWKQAFGRGTKGRAFTESHWLPLVELSEREVAHQTYAADVARNGRPRRVYVLGAVRDFHAGLLRLSKAFDRVWPQGSLTHESSEQWQKAVDQHSADIAKLEHDIFTPLGVSSHDAQESVDNNRDTILMFERTAPKGFPSAIGDAMKAVHAAAEENPAYRIALDKALATPVAMARLFAEGSRPGGLKGDASAKLYKDLSVVLETKGLDAKNTTLFDGAVKDGASLRR